MCNTHTYGFTGSPPVEKVEDPNNSILLEKVRCINQIHATLDSLEGTEYWEAMIIYVDALVGVCEEYDKLVEESANGLASICGFGREEANNE